MSKTLRFTIVALCMFLFFGSEVLAQQPPKPEPVKVRIATGKDGGMYFTAGRIVEAQSKGNPLFTTEVLKTKGSLDNINLIVAGEADVAFVQRDAIKMYLTNNTNATLDIEEGGSLYTEYVHLVCKDGVAKSITDLKPEHKVLIGPPGSGVHTTWTLFGKMIPALAKVQTDNIDDTRALNMIKEGTNAQCIMYVAGLNTGTMKKIDFQADGLRLVEIDDSSLLKEQYAKKPIYKQTEIPKGTYSKNLQTGWLSSVDTIGVDAMLITRAKFIEENEKAYNAFLDAFFYAQPKIKQMVGEGGK